MNQTTTHSNLRQIFLGLVAEHEIADKAIADGRYVRKNVRRRAVEAGLKLSELDRAMRDAKRPADEVRAEREEYERDLDWLAGREVGHQADWVGRAPTPVPAEESDDPNERQIKQVEAAGRHAGEIGADRETNPWRAGSNLADHWDAQWLAGRMAAGNGPPPSPEPPAKPGRRRPGRPPGVRNRRRGVTAH